MDKLTKEIGSQFHQGFENNIYKNLKDEDKEGYYQGTCSTILEK